MDPLLIYILETNKHVPTHITCMHIHMYMRECVCLKFLLIEENPPHLLPFLLCNLWWFMGIHSLQLDSSLILLHKAFRKLKCTFYYCEMYLYFFSMITSLLYNVAEGQTTEVDSTENSERVKLDLLGFTLHFQQAQFIRTFLILHSCRLSLKIWRKMMWILIIWLTR